MSSIIPQISSSSAPSVRFAWAGLTHFTLVALKWMCERAFERMSMRLLHYTPALYLNTAFKWTAVPDASFSLKWLKLRQWIWHHEGNINHLVFYWHAQCVLKFNELKVSYLHGFTSSWRRLSMQLWCGPSIIMTYWDEAFIKMLFL